VNAGTVAPPGILLMRRRGNWRCSPKRPCRKRYGIVCSYFQRPKLGFPIARSGTDYIKVDHSNQAFGHPRFTSLSQILVAKPFFLGVGGLGFDLDGCGGKLFLSHVAVAQGGMYIPWTAIFFLGNLPYVVKDTNMSPPA